MPRYEKGRDYQVGDYWLSKRGNSPAWCRTWFDPNTRQTCRVSLGTTDIEQAKQALTDWFVVNQRRERELPAGVSLAEVVARYWEHHGQHVASSQRTRIALNYWLDFFGDATVAELSSVPSQERFHQWLLDKGMKAASVKRTLTAGRAAVNYAWKRGEITSAPFIQMVVSRHEEESAPPRGRPMEMAEIARLIEATGNRHMRHFVAMMLATAARPEAIKELTLDRCKVEDRLIILNPAGRKQTTKYRPTVRMPESIVPLLQRLHAEPETAYVVGYGEQSVKSIKTAWRAARKRAGLDTEVNPYSLRHTMARWLRKQGVPAWEVSAQLGHKRQELSITEVYAPYDPTYLSNAVRAIDLFFAQLRASCVLVDELLRPLTH